MSAIKSFGNLTAVITVYSHPGAEDDVANFLARRPDMLRVIASYAEDYLKKGQPDFVMRQHTDEEVSNILQNSLARRMQTQNLQN